MGIPNLLFLPWLQGSVQREDLLLNQARGDLPLMGEIGIGGSTPEAQEHVEEGI